MKTSVTLLTASSLLLVAVSANVLQAKTVSLFPNEFIGKWTGEFTSSGSINIQANQIIQGHAREPNYCTPIKVTQTSPLEITVICKMRTSPQGNFQKKPVKLLVKRIGNQLTYNFSGLPNNWTEPLSRT